VRRNYHRALTTLFRRKPVVVLDDLRRALDTASRTTVFRALTSVGYHSSHSHAGKYYTLRPIPTFDADGLWFHRDVGFSSHGTLRATVTWLVEQAAAGHTHEELHTRLGLRVHDTLRSLVAARAIGRRTLGAVYVYVNAAADIGAAQLAQRRALLAAPASPAPPAPLELAQTVELLVEVIHHPKDDAATLARRLRGRGLAVSREQIEEVLQRHGVGKKTASSRSPRSRR